GAQQQNTRQRCSSTRHVNDTGTSKVTEAEVAQIVQAEYIFTTPGPGTFHRIDKGSHHHGEGQECPQLHPLSHRAGYNRHSGCYEYHLEEEVRRTGVNGIAMETIFTLSKLTQHRCCIHFGNTRQEITTTVHNLITTDQVHGAGNRKESNVFGKNFSGVFRTDQARFQHGETCRHPHY